MNFKDKLLEGVLDGKGLPYIALKLTEKLGKPVAISDEVGRILVIQSAKEMDISINNCLAVPKGTVNKYFYNKQNNIFYYQIGKEIATAYIIILNFEKEATEELINYLEDASLAIRFYFDKLKAVEEVEKKYKNEFIQDLLFNNIRSFEEITEKGKMWGWDLTKSYYVVIIEPDKNSKDTYIKMVNSYIDNYIYKNEVITCIRNGMIILIYPGEVEGNKLIPDDIYQLQKNINEKFGLTFSIGVGQPYSLINEIHKSYQEAKTAVAISRILGEQNFVTHFLELGIFRLLYKLDMYILKDFYFDTLGKIIEYDKNNNGALLITLETLFDSNIDWKKTADKLFIHVNTLRYRIKKIEELLKIDLNKLENQSNLFMALKIRALLKASNF
ncbi:hypothetical protein JOC37_000480 [Desulfohalotomaculum tongense]|uniref:PucR family transcriptional regulator n=1 Tax=Desulforadius tongensis TaxID=1216062 RepID=UPI00195D52B2|nr:helix-turn-helix domain-containing protein [Desulforadius tongensis]MBM7854108.1 hypothetical protein [Desulforadius tongensis]